MMKKQIINYLNEINPNPVCPLNYNKDYELLIAVMLSAQTTDNSVNKVTKVLFDKYDIYSLSKANKEDIETIIKPLGNYTKKSKYIIDIATSLVNNYNGTVPNKREYLESLSGVGRKTCNVVIGMLFGANVFPVDTHVERISKRLGIASEHDSVDKVEEKLMTYFNGENCMRLHEQFLYFGRNICKKRNPLCNKCKLKSICKMR